MKFIKRRNARWAGNTSNPGRADVSETKQEDTKPKDEGIMRNPKAFDPSPKVIDFIAAWEGFSREAYADTNNIPTVGYGFTTLNGRSVTWDDTVTKKQARIILTQKVDSFARGLGRALPRNIKMRQYELDALVSFVYNVGLGAFKRSTLLSMLKDMADGDALTYPEKQRLADQIKRWNRDDNGVNEGLVNRRNDEVQLFMEADYERL